MFFISGFFILAFIVVGIVVGNQFEDDDAAVGASFNYLATIGDYMGWFYVLATAFFLLFTIWLMFSRYGNVKIGPDDSKPEFRTSAWFAMLFTAGMGIGLVFWGAAEPTNYAMNGVVVDVTAEPAQQAREAMAPSFFHWGLQPWAIYIVLGLALGYFAHRKGLPLRPASAFYPLLGDRIYGWPGNLIDILAVFGTMFGLATSLGIGTMQINAGLSRLTDAVPANDIVVQVGIIAVITAIAVVSVVLGIDKGVRRLSVINIWLAGALLLFVFIAGPTLFIVNGIFDWTGTYLSSLVTDSLSVVDARLDPDLAAWQSGWTFFYWGWWISWAPFVGMFIARISRGRTIRQFVIGTLLAPVGASIVWFSTFGGSALFYDLPVINGIVADAEAQETGTGEEAYFEALEEGEVPIIGAGGEDSAAFLLLEQLPVAGAVLWLATLLTIVVVAIFFVTSSDSGSLVIDMLTNGGDPRPVAAQRVFWAVLEGVVTAVILVGGGLGALWILRATSVTTGLPFAVVLVFVCFGLVKALREENLTAIYARSLGLPVPRPDRNVPVGEARIGVGGRDGTQRSEAGDSSEGGSGDDSGDGSGSSGSGGD